MPHLTKELAYWINERYSILEKRRAGLPKTWSDDPIFQTVRFCNVHREDDAVTQWIRKNWNRADDPAWKFVLGRMINLPDTLARLTLATPYPEDVVIERCTTCLKNARASGNKVFTSAYTISTCGQKMDKIDYVLGVVEEVKDFEAVQRMRHSSCKETWEDLQRMDGLGSFLAAQVVADMKNTPGHPLVVAPDWWTFSAPGPGSLRGLSWYFAPQNMMHNGEQITAKDYHYYLKICRQEVDPLIDPRIPRISNQDFQNVCCEFSKWCKVKYLGGHVRNKFQGV